MVAYIAFLRGVNVGGHRKIKMSDLKQVHESMGHWNVATYLQSGNVFFECSENDREKLIESTEKEYERKLGFHTDVIIRSGDELGSTVTGCPFPLTENREAKFLHVIWLSGIPDSGAIGDLMMYEGPEEKQIAEDVLYVYYTEGSGRSKFTLSFIEKTLKVKGTARNWNTITKLLDLTAAP